MMRSSHMRDMRNKVVQVRMDYSRMIKSVMFGVHGRTMDGDAQAHIGARSHFQSGSAVSQGLPMNVYGLKISRVEVKNFPDYGISPLTTGGRMYWDGEAGNAPGQASRPCTTHEESSISRGDHTEEMSFI